MVYDSEDGIFAISEGKARDQVHSYLFKGSSIWGDCDSVEWGFLPMGNDFILLANGTSFDIVSDPVVHHWPLVELFRLSNRFISAGMSGCHVIVSVCHDRSQEVLCWFFQGGYLSDTRWRDHCDLLIVIFSLVYSGGT